MSKAGFYVVFDGPALEGSQMDVADLAPALLALSDLVREANTVLNGPKTAVQLKVNASFQTGCFGISLIAIQGVFKDLLSLCNSDSMNGALNLVNLLGLAGGTTIGLLKLIQKMAGRKISKVKIMDDERNAIIYIDEDQIKVELEIIHLLRNRRIRESIEKLIYQPLEKEGIDSFSVTKDKGSTEGAFTIEKKERDFFKSPPVEDEKIEDVEYEATYELISPVFQEDNKWRMSEGSGPFFVEMLDDDFIRQVQNSEISFAKGDLLSMTIQESKVLTGSGLKTTRKAVKVLSCRSRARQLPLPIDPPGNK